MVGGGGGGRGTKIPKIGSCGHSKNDALTHGSAILRKRMEIEHALFSSDTLLER